jgi:transcriptional regulator with XRE-family HTH domain
MSHATIRAIEGGYRAPSPELLEKLVAYLAIDPWSLFHDTEAIGG